LNQGSLNHEYGSLGWAEALMKTVQRNCHTLAIFKGMLRCGEMSG
jgi:hypothetical protein